MAEMMRGCQRLHQFLLWHSPLVLFSQQCGNSEIFLPLKTYREIYFGKLTTLAMVHFKESNKISLNF